MSVYGQNSQSTQRKQNHQSSLLLPRDIDSNQSRNGNNEDHQVSGDMHTGIRKPQSWFAQTETGNGVIPEFGHGNTIEKGADYSPGTVDSKYGYHDPAYNSHALCWEDAEVLH